MPTTPNFSTTLPSNRSAATSPQVTLLTPAGRGAIAVLSVSGAGSKAAVQKFFVSRTGFQSDQLEPERPYFGRWQCGDDFETSEELIIWIRTDFELEIQCHGGAWAWRRIVKDLEQVGVKWVPWETYLKSTYPNLIEREALIQLPFARTAKCAAILWDQREGALVNRIRAIRESVQSSQFQQSRKQIDELLKFANLGLRLIQDWKVVLVGAPNVGKSSLINAMLGFERAIVFDLPGTTRDVISDHTAIDGWPVSITDTVGLRVAESSIERSGIERTQFSAESADLLVFVFDDSGSGDFDSEFWVSKLNVPLLFVQNKIDLLPKHSVVSIRDNVHHTSALTGQGIAELMDQMVKRLVPEVPGAGSGVPFTERQINLLNLCATLLDGLLELAESIRPTDPEKKILLMTALDSLVND